MSKEGPAKKMSKEERLAAKEAVRKNGGIPPSEIASPKINEESTSVFPVEVPKSEPIPAAVEVAEAKVIPPELAQIFGDKIPSGVLRRYRMLGKNEKTLKTRGEYVAKLVADEVARKEKKSSKPRIRKPKPKAVAEPHVQAIEEAVPVISSAAQKLETKAQEEIDMNIEIERAKAGQKAMEEELEARRADSMPEKSEAEKVAERQREMEEEIEARRADMGTVRIPATPSPDEEKPAEEKIEEPKQPHNLSWNQRPEDTSKHTLDEFQHLIWNQKGYFVPKDKTVNGTTAVGEQPVAVKTGNVEVPSRETPPTPVPAEAEVAPVIEVPPVADVGKPEKETPIIPNPDDAIDPEHAWTMRRAAVGTKLTKGIEKQPAKGSFKVRTETRGDTLGGDDLEYIQIVPSNTERTPREWRKILKTLVKMLTP